MFNEHMNSLVRRILNSGLAAADPRERVREVLSIEGDCLRVMGEEYCGYNGIYVAGFGKASMGMAEGVYDALKGKVEQGVIIAPKGPQSNHIGSIKVLEGEHPLPGGLTLSSSLELLAFVSKLPEDSLLILLISGGGSALFEVPADNVSLEDISYSASMLMKSGADIVELNAVRKHLSKVKGGQLLRYINAEKTISLIISDVVGDRLDSIASGPTAPDRTTFQDALSVIEKYGLLDKISRSVREHIENGIKGQVPETVKPGDPILSKVDNFVIASNIISLKAMGEAAVLEGWKPFILTSRMRGEAREVAKLLAGIIESITHEGEPYAPPIILLAGGETTVTVRGKGIGGRNQELCLSLLLELGQREIGYSAACMGSDGIDGMSPAAGAYIDNSLLGEAYGMKMDPKRYLMDNNSYEFFRQLNRTIDTGYTGTNVNDFLVVVIRKPLQNGNR
ncbi:MAG: glycerate kinase [Desulfurococcales archaeon]|nr:glycerate kinase [Desulfurococcales archaeon]